MGIPISVSTTAGLPAIVDLLATDVTDQSTSSLTTIEIESIEWSYDNNPTNGRLFIESPVGTLVFQIDLPFPGVGFVKFGQCLKGPIGAGMKIVLADGGVNQKLTVVVRG